MSTTRAVGHYEIRELLGEGGIGQVHAAYDTMLDREVAIKSLRPELVNDKSFVDRFRSEANNLAKLTHPNITTLYSLLPEGGNLYMVMELVRGRTLEAILKEQGGPFSTQEALAVIGQAAEGLSYAHSMGIATDTNGHRRWSHSGGTAGVIGANVMLPDDHIAVAVLTNGESPKARSKLRPF